MAYTIKQFSGLLLSCLLFWPLSARLQPGLFPQLDVQAKEFVNSSKNRALMVGLLIEGRPYFSGYGKISKRNPAPPDARTIFELGALSGIFPGTMLAILEDKGIILPDATIQRVLPKGFEGPIFVKERLVSVTPAADSTNPNPEPIVTCLPDPISGQQEIALCQLAYHASGLTCSCGALYRWHPQARQELSATPPHDVPSTEAFLREAAQFTFASAPGLQYVFSNIGIAYLGNLLAANQGLSFEALLARELTKPLGMQDTRVHLLPVQQPRVAPGHSKAGKPVPAWNFEGMAPAAGIKSSAFDLIQFVKAHLQQIPGISYNAAVQARQGMIEARFPGWPYPTQAAYGWLVSTDASNRSITWMNGGTGGYRSFLAFDAQRKIGIVVLANSQHDVTMLGFQMLQTLLEQR